MAGQSSLANKLALPWERPRRPPCGSKIRVMIINFWCTRKRGHKGAHQMNGAVPDLIYHTWRSAK